VFSSVDKVIQSGQDPRRFVEDLLEKLRDLIVVLSVGDEAKSVLRGIAPAELEKMGLQAMSFGMAELTHAAGAVANALTEMSGATSPKLQLELMCAKVLVPASDKTEVGSLARIERLERRMGVAPAAEQVSAPVAASAPRVAAPKVAPAAPRAETPQPAKVAATQVAKPAAGSVPAVTQQVLMSAWAEIIGQVKKESRAAWMVAFTLTVMDLTDDVLTLKFLSQKDLDSFKADSRSTDALRKAIFAVLGIQVKFRPHIEEGAEVASVTEQAEPATTVIPVIDQEVNEVSEPKSAPSSRNSMVNEDSRYGESLLREVLGAEPIQDPKTGGR
jgi:DNA polymerase-3 subunit gamma/tau